jgi:hypothetical protein
MDCHHCSPFFHPLSSRLKVIVLNNPYSRPAWLLQSFIRLFSGISNSLLNGNTYMADSAPKELVPSLKQFEVSLKILSQDY